MYRALDADVFSPEFGLVVNELLHQIHAFLIVENVQVDSAHHQILLGSLEGAVLPHYNSRDTVEQRGSAAHIARRQSRVKHAALVVFGLQSPGVLQTVHLGMQDGAPFLNAPIVASADNFAVQNQNGPDRNAAFGQPEAGFFQCSLQKQLIAHNGATFALDATYPSL